MTVDLFTPQVSSYAKHALHSLLSPDAGRLEGPNIGVDGRHLAIATRYLDGEALQIFTRSIALQRQVGFLGEALLVLAPDCHSLQAKLEHELRRAHPQGRVILASGSSEARLRNAAAAAASAKWLLWLDPHLEIEWNVSPFLQRDLSELGCSFLVLRASNSALEESRCHLLPSSENGRVDIRLGSTTVDRTFTSYLATGFGGPGYLMEIQAFSSVGGYDEDLSGLEDLDLSIRIFQHGLKLGVAALGGFKLAGERSILPAPATRDVRASFERKYHFDELPGDEANGAIAVRPSRPRIALIVDVENWAFANIARQVEASLGHRFDFEIIPIAVIADHAQAFMMCEGADLVHVFWREVVNNIYQPSYQQHLSQIGIGFEFFKERYLDTKPITTAVYDHMYLEHVETEERRSLFSDYVNSYYVSSQRLYDIYSRIKGYPVPSAVLPDGVDLKRFRPMNLERFERMQDRPIVVGWVGNSTWSAHLGDPKGLHTILKPALEELNAEGLRFVSDFADRQVAMIPHERMPAYYAKIDVLVCASDIEGTPNPVLEAMASGVPVVSTDVGVVPQAFGPLQGEFILKERNTSAMKAALRRLYRDRALFAALSSENLDSIKSWDWPLRAAQFAPFFTQAMEKHARTSPQRHGETGTFSLPGGRSSRR
jgi:glycosyltransferase involved in cell wall biosynthesis